MVSCVSFITTHGAYASTNKSKIVWIETDFLFIFLFNFSHPGGLALGLIKTCVLGRYCFHSLISTQTFQRALTASVDSCAEIKSAPSVA